jgi:hypothetical protein
MAKQRRRYFPGSKTRFYEGYAHFTKPPLDSIRIEMAAARKTKDKPCNIYLITCLVRGKKYIGITVGTVRQRWSNHVTGAKANRCPGSYLHKAIRRYGSQSFKIETIYQADSRSEAEVCERGLIAAHRTFAPAGMNMTSGGEGTRDFCRPHSQTTRHKIGEANRKRVITAETRLRQSIAHSGKKLSDAHRKALSEARKGKPKSVEQRKKQADSVRGRKFPRRSIALLESLICGGSPNPSGFRGVIQEGASTWTARLGINGRRVHLGTFSSPELAHAAYIAAVKIRIEELRAMIPEAVST